MDSRTRYCLALLTLLVPLWSAVAAPGDVIELRATGTLSPQQVDERVSGRFRNDGQSPPSAATAVDTYLVRYESTWPSGEPAEITAQLFVPQQQAEQPSTLVFAPGSTGLVENCAPSRPFVDSGSYGTYNAYTLAYAGQGLVAMMPNYMGFFDVGVIQPYFDRLAEGAAVLDAIRATAAALDQLGRSSPPTAFVAGYSQGGHAAFAAADLHSEYAPEVPLAGVIGFGATTMMVPLFLEFTFVAPWVIHSYATFHPDRIDPAELLVEPYLSRLSADAESLCILEAQRYYPAAPESLFRPEFTAALRDGSLGERYPDLAELFRENDAGLGGHEIPAIILQGVDDPVVTFDTQTRFVEQLCTAGSPVRYPNYLRTRHETRYIGFGEAIDWMRALVAGQRAPNDCEDLSTTD